MNPSKKKAERLLDIEAMLLGHPDGLTQAEIARRLGVNRSTIHRYLSELTEHSAMYENEEGRLFIDRAAYLVNVRLNLHQAMAVHLAARLLATRMDRQNPHAAAALRKLGIALTRLSPRISHHLTQSADVMDDIAQRHDPVYLGVLEKLTLAWAEERKVQVWHRYEKTGDVNKYLFAPYYIEPYAVGQTTHVIGFREPPHKVRTFKIERIERVELTRERHTIPENFDPRELLADAWGIWYTEAEPVEVALRFHPRVAHRMRETRWHRSERVEEQADGSLIWRARVSEPQEMLPWIRGWGADVEVLGPVKLRKTFRREASRFSKLYLEGEEASSPDYFHLWAKTSRETPEWHPLLYHLIDVGQVTLALWENALGEGIRQRLASWLGLGADDAGRLLAFWAGLHDLGKASPAFQDHPFMSPYFKSRLIPNLKSVGFNFPIRGGEKRARHEVISTWALKSLLASDAGMEPPTARRIAHAIGGHHGAWPTPDKFSPASLKSIDRGDETWDAARRALVQEMQKVFNPPKNVRFPDNQLAENALLTLFSGLTSVADWIGSMEQFFSCEDLYMPAAEYAKQAAGYAHEALQTLGWIGWKPSSEQFSFKAMFDFIPNDVQKAVISATKEISPPALLILEAPTGIGKTETALYLADRWLQIAQGSGLYVAMPTQATSNQMFGRVVDFLKTRYSSQVINTHLIHGQARFSEKMAELKMNTVAGDQAGGSARIAAMAWFLPRKRTLLSPFGVGTVDQALMSILQTRHFFVRLLGLSHKVIVFDEVHAYDTYMSTLFHRLLGWLHAVGTSVIILSATLPEQTRQELAAAYLGKSQIDLRGAVYPRLTIVTEKETSSTPLPAPPDRSLSIEWINRQPEDIAQSLEKELRDGGCAAVICNRVARAQEIYRRIRDAGIVNDEYLILFHARFPFAWRDEIEQKVLGLFSKGCKRPHKAIVVATQVIEQSLDLDFDLMITDLPAADLLLQRAGRLHRHAINDETRPARLSNPRLLITLPQTKNTVPDFGKDEHVYARYVLLQTWRVLQGKAHLMLPTDTSPLIEGVYGLEPVYEGTEPALAEALRTSRDEMRIKREKDESKAKTRLVLKASDEELLDKANQGLDEDDPTIHQDFQAMTRLIEPGISLVCLHRTPGGLALEPDGRGTPLDLETEPDRKQIEDLVKRVVTVRRWGVLKHFQSQEPPKAWKDVAALRYHHLAVFEDGRCPLEDTSIVLSLDRETGLDVITIGKEDL